MRLRLASVSVIACGALVAQADWFDTYIAQRTHLSGYRNIGFHFEQVTGDTDAYGQGNYGGQGGNRVTDLGYIRVEGRKVADLFNFDLNIQDSRFSDPQAQNVSLGIDKGNWQLGAGDIQGSLLNTNPFASFNRRLRGVSAGYHAGSIRVKALRTQAEGDPRSVSIQGNNTPGPYYLQSSQIVRGSERILVDGIEQRFGDDYSIDYDLGSIVFENRTSGTSKVISPSSTIVASYESFGFGGPSGTVEGVGLSVAAGRFGQIGLTGVRQLSGGGASNSSRLEQFQGFGPPTVPYTLQFTPNNAFPVTIRIDGVVQVANVDYHFDGSNASVFFINRFVPSTSTVDCLYTPLSNNDVQGDRQVWGLDWTAGFAKGGSVKISEAMGSLTNSTTPKSGMARSLDAGYEFGRFKLGTSLKSVDDDFVSVSSTGLNRNEKSASFSASFRPNDERTWDASWLNSAVADISSGGITRSRFSSTSISHSITPSDQKLWPLSVNFQTSKSSSLGSESDSNTTSISTRYGFGKLNESISASNSQISGTSTGSVNSLSTNTRYAASSRLFFQLGASLSQINSNGDTGTGRDLSLSANYIASDRLTARLSVADSDAGSVTSIAGLTSGYGYGVSGNGFSNSPDSISSYSAASGRRIQLDLEGRPNDRAVLGLGIYSNLSRGSVTSNALTQGVTAYGTLESNSRLRVQGNLGISRSSYDGSDATPTSTTLGLNLDGDLGKRWAYSTRFSTAVSSGNTGFDQDNTLLNSSLSYALANRQTLALSFEGSRTRGYLPQDDSNWALTYRYQLWRSLGINLSYQDHVVSNLDPTVTTGAYHSHGLHLEFSFALAP